MSLDRVPSGYPLWVVALVVAIFCAPNLLLFAAIGADGLGETVELSATEMVLNLIITVIMQLVVFLLSVLPLLAAGRPYSRLFGPTRATGVMAAIGVGVGFVTVVVTYAVNTVVVLIFGAGDPVEQDLLDSALSGGAVTVLAVLIAVVLAPITEEVVFRGVLHRALGERIGMTAGAVASSTIFALIHLEVVLSQPLGLVGLFMVGLLLAIAYHVTGSLIVPIVGHAVFNAVSITVAIVADRVMTSPASIAAAIGPG